MNTTMSFSLDKWCALRESRRGFLYICKGGQRQRKVGVCTLPCAIAVGLTQRWICNVCVDAAYLWRHFRYTLLHLSHHSFRFDRSGIEPRTLRSTETEALILPFVSILTRVQRGTAARIQRLLWCFTVLPMLAFANLINFQLFRTGPSLWRCEFNLSANHPNLSRQFDSNIMLSTMPHIIVLKRNLY